MQMPITNRKRAVCARFSRSSLAHFVVGRIAVCLRNVAERYEFILGTSKQMKLVTRREIKVVRATFLFFATWKCDIKICLPQPMNGAAPTRNGALIMTLMVERDALLNLQTFGR